jgi:hypothetical protein
MSTPNLPPESSDDRQPAAADDFSFDWPQGPRPSETELARGLFKPRPTFAQWMKEPFTLRNVYPSDHEHLSVRELHRRGWSRRMIARLLGLEDRRDSVEHWANYAGRKMFALDRVERLESLELFEQLFLRACRHSAEFRAMKQEVLNRSRELRSQRRAEAPPLEASAKDRAWQQIEAHFQRAAYARHPWPIHRG